MLCRVTLTDSTRYLEVAPSSLNRVEPGAYIGTATKSIGDQLIALEVAIFPPSLKGTGEGHYAWGPHAGHDAIGRRRRA
jgi:hypothetical protein